MRGSRRSRRVGVALVAVVATAGAVSSVSAASASAQAAPLRPLVKASQTVSFTSVPPSPAVIGETYSPTATATSGLPVIVGLAAASRGCTLAGGLVAFTGVGRCLMVAAQAGNAAFFVARARQTIAVVKAPQTITFTSVAPSPALVGSTYQLMASASSGLPVQFRLGATSSGCTMAAGLVRFRAAGSCVLDAHQIGSASYQAATVIMQIIAVTTKPQTVAFTSTAPSPGLVGGTYSPTASATSGLPAAISLDISSVGCALTGAVVTFTGAGVCVLNADQPGARAYGPAEQATQSIQVIQQSQTITFTSIAPDAPAINTTYTPTATATSGLTVAITLDTTSTGCTLTGTVVTFTGAGACVVDADQPGDATYSAAAEVQQIVTIVPPAPTAVDDSATVDKNLDPTNTVGTTIDVLANDSPGIDPLTITAVTQVMRMGVPVRRCACSTRCARKLATTSR